MNDIITNEERNAILKEFTNETSLGDSIMKTIFIYDSCGMDVILYTTKDGDYSHLNNKYINSMETTDEESDQINEILYNPEGHENAWANRDELTKDFPYEATKGEFVVVVIGMLP